MNYVRAHAGTFRRLAFNVTATVEVYALAHEHIPAVLSACRRWAELAQHGPPYWRPRSPSELVRKIADASGPQVSTGYSFVVAAPGGRLLGECSVHAIDWRNRCAQVGVCVWSTEDRGSGYGRAAVQYTIDWAIAYLGLFRLEAWIVDGNEPSIGLFRSFGFEYEGTLRERYLSAGVRRDVQIWSLLAKGN